MRLTPMLVSYYNRKWNDCTFPEDEALSKLASDIRSNQPVYRLVEQECKNRVGASDVGRIPPWWLIGVIHAMESNLDFETMLHNGELLPGPTTDWPAGRGPFKTWERAAVDAILLDLPLFPMTGSRLYTYPWNVCYFLEGYNGWGYMRYHPDVPSQYLWSKTSVGSETGKYTRDGHWEQEAESTQYGAMAIISAMIDKGIIPDLGYREANPFAHTRITEGSPLIRLNGCTLETLETQRWLNRFGFNPALKTDGWWGPKTENRWSEITSSKEEPRPPVTGYEV